MPVQLSQASKDKLNRQIATINQWPELEVNGCLEDCKNNPVKILELVLTLKHHANPLGGYPKYTDVEEALANIILCLTEPEQLQPGLKLSADEKDYLIEMMRLALDKLANEIILENEIKQEDIQKAILNNIQLFDEPSAPPSTPPSIRKFEPPKPSAPPLTAEEQQDILMERWWNNLTVEQQREIKKRHEELNQEQTLHLEQRTTYYYHYSAKKNKLFHYHQMCLIDAELNYFTLRAAVDVSALVFRGLIYSAGAAVRIGMAVGDSWGRSRNSHSSRSNSSNISGKGEGLGILVLIAAGIALASAAIVGAVYALKKVFNSFRNIFHGEKILRSLYRLAATGGGTYLGVFAGAILGGMVGSAFPVLGTAAGAILGMIFGAGIGAGLGSIIAKYSAKLISRLVYKDELNPSNPDKWRLNKKQIALMQYQGIDITKVNDEIKRIKDEKSHISGIKGSFPGTKARKEKNELNRQLKEIKNVNNIVKQYPPVYSFFRPVPSAPFEYSITHTTTTRVRVR